jgi:hypothetical protein
MRHIILLDNKIPDKDYQKWVKEDAAFWKQHIDITPTYEVIRTDYTTYPTYIDSDFDIRPTDAYLRGLNAAAIKSNGEFGTDFVMVMIHEDNWRSDTETTKGIWGTNYSYVFGKQCLDYCRWDKDNSANTFGTAYHERFHSFDAIIKVELGIDVNPILGTKAFDSEIVHGKNPTYAYIRHKENTEVLKVLKPYLVQAFQKRKERHEVVVHGLMEQIISLGTKLLYILRAKQNSKYGVPKTL